MDVLKWGLTFVVICVTIWLLSVTYIILSLNNLEWNQKVIQSKIDTVVLKHELYLKRLNHERYKEQRVTDPQG